jgi:hypothetical protein
VGDIVPHLTALAGQLANPRHLDSLSGVLSEALWALRKRAR